VKFKPGLKNNLLPTFPDNMCMNFNTALTGEEIDPLCPNGSTCCSANNFAGCDDSNCQAIVCSIDPDCCDINWGFDCRNTASDFCSFALGSTETTKANLEWVTTQDLNLLQHVTIQILVAILYSVMLVIAAVKGVVFLLTHR
jgi:hypothetical protein